MTMKKKIDAKKTEKLSPNRSATLPAAKRPNNELALINEIKYAENS